MIATIAVPTHSTDGLGIPLLPTCHYMFVVTCIDFMEGNRELEPIETLCTFGSVPVHVYNSIVLFSQHFWWKFLMHTSL